MAHNSVRVFGSVGALLATTLAATLILDLKPQRKMILFRIQMILLFFMVLSVMTRFVWVNLLVLLPFRRTEQTTLLVIHWLSYIALVAFVALAFFSIPVGRFFVGFEPYLISRMAFTCLGLLVLIFFNLCVLNVFFFMLQLCNFELPNADRCKSGIATIISLSLCVYGLFSASRDPEIKGVRIPLAKLPQSLHGTTIIQLSDIHLGPMVGKADLSRVVSMVAIIRPDIIVITGDLVDSTVENLKQVTQVLKGLRSKYGTFFVTGNHEYFTGDVDVWLQELKELGIHPLHNSHVFISSTKNPEDKIFLAGVDDIEADRLSYEGHGMKLAEALSAKLDKYPIILLAHQPRAAQQALIQFAGIDLILCGHTHGGQFFPFNILVYFFNPFFSGLYKQKDTFVYVSSGTYFYGIPFRIGSRKEITLITLVQGEK